MTGKLSLIYEGEEILNVYSKEEHYNINRIKTEDKVMEVINIAKEGKVWEGVELPVPIGFETSKQYPYLYEAKLNKDTKLYIPKKFTETILKPKIPKVALTLLESLPEEFTPVESAHPGIYHTHVGEYGYYLVVKGESIYYVNLEGDKSEDINNAIQTYTLVDYNRDYRYIYQIVKEIELTKGDVSKTHYVNKTGNIGEEDYAAALSVISNGQTIVALTGEDE